jgi:hypothetical protein
MAPALGGWVTHHTPFPPVQDLLDRLDRLFLTGDATMCPYLTPTTAAPAWKPGRIHACIDCFVRACERIKGTHEDHRLGRYSLGWPRWTALANR